MSVLVALAQYPKIETARLILRPMTKDDLDDYHAFTSNDDHLRYAFFPHRSMEESWEGLVLYNLKEPIGKYGIVLLEIFTLNLQSNLIHLSLAILSTMPILDKVT